MTLAALYVRGAVTVGVHLQLVRDNLQIRQVVLDTQLGVSIFRGSILVNNSTMVRMLAFFVSVFFVLIKIKRGQDA